MTDEGANAGVAAGNRPLVTDGGEDTAGGEDAAGEEGYDEWLAALAEGEGYYLVCPNDHGSLPPRRRCPHCSSGELTERTLPETGTIETFTETQVPIPSFSEDAPYVVAIVDFGDVRVTGQLRGIDPAEVAVGATVSPDVVERETTGEPLIVFRPV
ncbi:Zn-ribbon domain-containing OB-fold protein [Salinarchaeum chitinilyticum]